MAGRSDELAIQNAIRLEHGSGPARLWRNNTGALKDATGRLVRYGLCPGSSDLIGLRTRIITEAEVFELICNGNTVVGCEYRKAGKI